MVDNADEWVQGTIQYYTQAIQNYAGSQDEAVDEIFPNIQQNQELILRSYFSAHEDGVDEIEIRINDLQLQFQHFCTIERSSFDHQIRQLKSTILLSQQLIQQIQIHLSLVQQSPDETGIQLRRTRELQLHKVQHLHKLLDNRKQIIIQKILNFYVKKVVDGHKVTPEIVDRCLMNNDVGPKLFADISGIIKHPTYKKSNYHHHGGIRCNWDEETSNAFNSIVGEYDEYINKLKTNHGNIKTVSMKFLVEIDLVVNNEYSYDKPKM
ncbi:hypothetical protein GLOIN_2v1477106 [Rhizophagus irregularis DAOM 181602=DAOM 197198]|uniref:Uncharacterized protein n=1 Tax=Rhizophagus irregularis (strain DAOM 181602 / DAOM 197198 / MUCL 43194) TaxID=747089 RepID=A0A2P4Q699_RHIID|nr:hypothetical protein GLOIN_2v1477106 [Rhizophagus irregularis DAOM 181602=DAOM 197198]POG73179.1 hypothetical protein GLOIN_2v1477106 [Rhizophagus irregularis DAOM 181602=DAOM 197198]|eukprot:XP_025180045.1 hypothetical protein GLOIN_2v1477106 [Rhizophagus irregularis DAOM 181602=DAOM 197198]